MYTSEALLDLHERSHRSLKELMAHCRQLSADELDRELAGFGYASVRLQLHHEISAQKYWIGVLQGRMDVDENDSDYPTVDSLESYRQQVYILTVEYLRDASVDELNTASRSISPPCCASPRGPTIPAWLR